MHLSLKPKPKFLEILAKKVIVYDGAMGTNLFNYNLTADDYGGAAFEGCPEMLNKTKPEIIQEIHRNFFSAGADIVETNINKFITNENIKTLSILSPYGTGKSQLLHKIFEKKEGKCTENYTREMRW